MWSKRHSRGLHQGLQIHGLDPKSHPEQLSGSHSLHAALLWDHSDPGPSDPRTPDPRTLRPSDPDPWTLGPPDPRTPRSLDPRTPGPSNPRITELSSLATPSSHPCELRTLGALSLPMAVERGLYNCLGIKVIQPREEAAPACLISNIKTGGNPGRLGDFPGLGCIGL